MKIVTIVGTRPELIKLSSVIKKLDNHSNHVLIHTGQNFDYELNEVFFNDLGIRKPDFFLDTAKSNMAETIADILVKSYEVLSKINPDALLVYGDTNSCLSVIMAKRLQIPVFHMEAGNRCFDQRTPEEINRKIVDHLSDINMPISEHARSYLIREGIRPETIIKIGSSMPEVLKNSMLNINSSQIINTLKLKSQDFFVLSLHREENVDSKENLTKIIGCLNAIIKEFNKEIIFSLHPRTKKRLENLGLKKSMSSKIRFSKPLGFNDYIKLQLESFCVISDSGTISEESSILKIPAITIRENHERPEAMDEGTLIMSGLSPDNVIDSIKIVTSKNKLEINTVSDYKDLNISEKVLRIIFSHVDYINKNVWKKY